MRSPAAICSSSGRSRNSPASRHRFGSYEGRSRVELHVSEEHSDGRRRRLPVTRSISSQIKPAYQVIVVQLLRRSSLELDVAMHDDITTIGNTNCLRKVLLRH